MDMSHADTDDESVETIADAREMMQENLAQVMHKCIFEAMHEAYHARDSEEEQFMNEVRLIGFQHPKEMFEWCKEILARMRKWHTENVGADPAAPMHITLRRGMYLQSPGVCSICREDAHINAPADDPLRSICHTCMRKRGIAPGSVYECFRGVAAPRFAKLIEPVMWPHVDTIKPQKPAEPKHTSLSRDESFLTGTSLKQPRRKTTKRK